MPPANRWAPRSSDCRRRGRLVVRFGVPGRTTRAVGPYVIREADDCNERCFLDRKNYRVVLGADLVRLVSGKSAALKTESAEGRGSD